MSIFSTILEKLGLSKPAAAGSPRPVAGAPGPSSAPKPAGGAPAPQGMPFNVGAPQPTPMAMVDVMSKLNKLAGDKSGLDWKVSIVDLLKLLDIDSSLNARKELANELGCPPNLIKPDYADMNVWLQKTVLQKIADNGGNIPASLLKK